jgi:hypothetical protein
MQYLILYPIPIFMKKSITLLAALALAISTTLAQTSTNTFSIREEIIKPPMTARFMEAMKKFKAACEESKVTFTWTTLLFDDNTIMFVAPINSMAELDKNPFAPLETKFGKEGAGKIWAEFDGCIESYTDYVVTRLPEYSYLSPPAGENARDILYWYVEPGKEREAQVLMAEWKKLYETKKSPSGFTVYRTMMGKEFGYAIVSWGKGPADIAMKVEKNHELFGQEAGALWAKTQAITRKYFSKRAVVMPEYSYNGPK